ncbi:citrate/2-methylcitrate synthase [Glutamicibacter protophormiae]|uniref:citrate/2-methylcitrate synthase n=1 Tax=Glutamicibacter protophormiae TaxID=37930 RepID=UPI003A8CB7AC
MTATEEIKKGPAGVVDYTAVSKVNPETNSLLYRGYPVQDLAANKSFEEVALLLWNGELPTASELTEFSAFERANRALDPRVKAAIDLLPTDCHPDGPHRGLGHRRQPPAGGELLPEAELLKAKELFAAFPAVVAYDQLRRRGRAQPRARTWITRRTSCG